MPTARLDEGARLLAGMILARTGREEMWKLTSPGNDVDEGAVQAGRDREQEAVRQAWQSCVRNRELADEAYSSDAIACHDERRSLMDFVGPECEDDGHEHGEDVDWDCEELGIGG
jgi:hypothetical protein